MSEYAQQLASAGVPVFPCQANKVPAVPKGVSWQSVATLAPAGAVWPSAMVGVPVPHGAVIIDMDLYKGVTRDQVERALGCLLPWDAALIQRTEHGGEHYAFAVDWDVVQGSDLFEIKGFDTRCAGRGYICTGPAYPWIGFGPLRLANPAALLPQLPPGARHVLERVEREVNAAPLPQGDRDVDLVRDALRYVNADCSRADWVNVGMALKHHFHDAPDTGFALFKEWSEYAPDRLDYDSLEPQWESFKAVRSDGASITVASVVYMAMQNGYHPPAGFDSSAAFGVGAAPVEVFGELVDRIQAHGGDPKATSELIDAIRGAACSDIQRATLSATLHRELKEAGLLTKQVRATLDAAVTGRAAPVEGARNTPGRYGKNHTENAVMFLDRCFPPGGLLRSEEIWYSYGGLCWEEQSDDSVKHSVFRAMVDSLPQDSTISGTYGILSKMCFTAHKIGRTPHNLLIYQNGVLDLNTMQLGPHRQDYFTTNMLPYNYAPAAQCSRWLQFLGELVNGDQERIALLQEWFGYMLAASYRYHKIMLLIGPPRSGKGTIGRILDKVVGSQNFSGGSLHAFASDKFLNSLRTKPVMFIGDAEKKIARNSIGVIIERLKTISGNDAVSFDRIYKSSLTEALPSRITIASNNIPSLFDDSGALAGRFLILPLDVSFTGREDPRLLDALLPEVEGIAAWALAGLQRLEANGRFTEPQASLDETRYVAETYSPLQRFIEEECRDADTATSGDRLYEAYAAWAASSHEDQVLTRRQFTSAFKDATRGRFRYGSHRFGATVERGFDRLQLRSATAAAFGGAV